MAKPAGEKLLSEVLRERRATPHFEPTPLHEDDLKKIMGAAMEAPSGYNLQPWRFLVVRDPEQRKRLRDAAMGQPKVEEAPLVIVACGDPDGWRTGDLEMMLQMGNERGFPDSGNEPTRQAITGLLGGSMESGAGIEQNVKIWVNRHVMIAFTTMMLMAEALGYDTAPMEGFYEDKVRDVLGIPAHVKVVALLAIGHRRGNDKPYGGRFPAERIVYADRWGEPLKL